MWCHADGIKEYTVEGADDSKARLLCASRNAPCGLRLDIVHRPQNPFKIQIVVDRLVLGRAAEQIDDAGLCGADELRHFLQAEIGIQVRQFLIQSRLDDGHQFVIIAQIGLTHQFLMTDDQFL